jgi:uncharacterized protein with GYD domain
MPLYLTRFSHTPETWQRLIDRPEDRREAVGALAESFGGKLHGLWYAFGEYDGYVLLEAPDNASAAAALIAVAGSGAFRSVETTVLIPVEEGLEALRKAREIEYRPPGGAS